MIQRTARQTVLAAALSGALCATHLAAETYQGAGQAPALPSSSPLPGDQQRASFAVPPGFTVELVAAEPDVEKAVAFNFDHAGRMWVITATEYPIDGNEQPEEARQLYERGGKDRVLVFEQPWSGSRLKPRVFADGMAIPLGVLPLASNKVMIAQGPEIFTLTDTDNDGRGDKKEILLTGFGIQDSHLMPHQLTRGPGDWIYFAQGAFNYSQVRTKEGTVVQFDQCKLGRFKADGSQFEIVGWGLNNIWGLALTSTGEMFIQEANDLGYPVVPFEVGANYPGIGMHRAKPYAPWQAPLGNHIQMGGTGLSGLAYAEGVEGFRGAYGGLFYLANPITSKLQAVKGARGAESWSLEKMPDFATTQDTWFRPVAMQFGPDGSLYVIDWYNKIISHNEVPRAHPERDKSRSRIWRIRQDAQGAARVPDVEALPAAALVRLIDSDMSWARRAAWQAVADRKAVEIVEPLTVLARDTNRAVERRLSALWALESLQRIERDTFEKLLVDSNADVRREAVRALQSSPLLSDAPNLLAALEHEEVPAVRSEMVRTLTRTRTSASTQLLIEMIRGPLEGEPVRAQQEGKMALAGRAGDRAFERYLIRAALEERPAQAREFLATVPTPISAESGALVALAFGAAEDADRLAGLATQLNRSLSEEETLLLARFADRPQPQAALSRIMQAPTPAVRQNLLEQLWSVREQIDGTKLRGLVEPVLSQWQPQTTSERARVADFAAAFKIANLQPQLIQWVGSPDLNPDQRARMLRALGELGAAPDLFYNQSLQHPAAAVQLECAAALARHPSPSARQSLFRLWPHLSLLPRQRAIELLTGSKSGAEELLMAIANDTIPADSVDSFAIEKLSGLFPNDARVAALQAESNLHLPVLRLFGSGSDLVETGQTVAGAFTIEAWVRLADGISNADAIAGGGDYDFNFHDGRLRAHFSGAGDVAIASKPILPNTWTHCAITRTKEGVITIYQNGMEVARAQQKIDRDLNNVVIGGSMASGGLSGEVAEFRIWSRSRSLEELNATANVRLTIENAEGLTFLYPGSKAKLTGAARVDRSSDTPEFLKFEDMVALEAKFKDFRRLASAGGDVARGREVFTQACATCHSVQGQGGQIGPALNGAGAMGLDALLRSIVTPNAMMESGYRKFHVQLANDESVEGFLVRESAEALVLRSINSPDVTIPRAQVRKASFSRVSLMPEGLLESLPPSSVSDLFAYLQTLK